MTGINDWLGYSLASWHYLFVEIGEYQWNCDFWSYIFEAVNWIYNEVAYTETNRYMEAELAIRDKEKAKSMGKD